MRIKLTFLFLISLFIFKPGDSQIQTQIYDSSAYIRSEYAFFFTNRPIKTNKDSTLSFKNKSKKQTNTLYFCLFNYEKDSIEFRYKAANPSGKFPNGNVERNFFYDIYQDITIDRGINTYYFIIPGYGKTFKNQVYKFMRRLKSTYGDTLSTKVAIITFAWGAEDEALKYYSGVRSAKRGAGDFAIFQHMLEDFLNDSIYFQNNPNDVSFNLLCSSMGNNLLLKYLKQREKNKASLTKVYSHVLFVGSSVSRNSFKKGKPFYHLNQMTDTVDVFVNLYDAPLSFAGFLSFKKRLGKYGPKNEKDLPGYINVLHVGKILSAQDLPGFGHDYLFRNPIVREKLISGGVIEQNETKKPINNE